MTGGVRARAGRVRFRMLALIATCTLINYLDRTVLGIAAPRLTAELGISIHDPEYWGGGYGSEAAALMVEYGMYFLGLHNIVLNVFSYNTRGIAAYEKVGFREIGRRRGAIRLGQERFDAVLMDITADEVDTSRMRGLVRLLDDR